MSRKLLAIVLATVAAFLFSFYTALTASAHSPTAFYYSASPFGSWPVGHNEGFLIRSTGFPNSTYYDRIVDGARAWNHAAESSNEPGFIYNGLTSSSGSGQPCNVSWSGVYYTTLPDGVWGRTNGCKNSNNTLVNFSLLFSAHLPQIPLTTWYTGTGAPAGSQLDLWSVAIHEFGHATAWSGHISNICPENDSDAQTMCGNLNPGTNYFRTLATHDKHTFNAQY